MITIEYAWDIAIPNSTVASSAKYPGAELAIIPSLPSLVSP